MNLPILLGLDTEYGLYVEGRGAEDQTEDSEALVRSYPGKRFEVWDARFESPRADLRGFSVSHLAFDPEDAKFDEGRAQKSAAEARADRVLPNGARFYNDHGHPEYATPECASVWELIRQDEAGQRVVLEAGRAFAEKSGREVRLYKNNTDFHGASYGTHESYLVPRAIGWEPLYRSLAPLFAVRSVLCGAGKVGYEAGSPCDFQLSQRADFFVEPFNTETLYRRPLFNLRDEPHADPKQWMRLHVICGDSNLSRWSAAFKVGLTLMAIRLALREEAPPIRLSDPVRAAQSVSRDLTGDARLDLHGGQWTTAESILDAYLGAAEQLLVDDLWWIKEGAFIADRARNVLDARRSDPESFARHVDWAAKRALLDEIRESEDRSWGDPAMKAFDLEYHNVDPEASLFQALVEMDRIEAPDLGEPLSPEDAPPDTRAWWRGLAVERFSDELHSLSWRAATFRRGDGLESVELPPDSPGKPDGPVPTDVESFIRMIRGQA